MIGGFFVIKKKSTLFTNNIWDREGFQMCGWGEKSKTVVKIKYFRKCVRWSWQRIVRGYADWDKYFAEERKLEEYRNEAKNEAFDMMKEYFFCQWD